MNASNKIWSMLSLMLAMTGVTTANNRLYNDTCSSVVTGNNISSRVIKVECQPGSVTFDPKSQYGAFLYDNETDSWTGEIFVCQCSCHLQNYIPNGRIFSESTIPHGEMLDYKCDAGFEKTITSMIVCFDGLLMTISDYSNYSHINTSFRQMSLPVTFAEDFKGYIFHLELNATADWSLPEEEVRYNQKVFRIIDNEAEPLIYMYLHNGSGYQVGRVDLKMHQKIECVKMKNTGITNTLLSEASESERIPTFYIIIIIIAGLIYLVAAATWGCRDNKQRPPSKMGTDDERENLNSLIESGEENNIYEISDFEERHAKG